MLQQSRRRFLAGLAFFSGSGMMAGRGAMAQTASTFKCEGPITAKAITALKPSSANGGVYQTLSGGRLTLDAAAFGQKNDIRFYGKPGKLAKGVAVPVYSRSSIMDLSYTRADARGYESFYLKIEYATVLLDALFPADRSRISVVIPGLKGTNFTLDPGIDWTTRTVMPTVSASFSAGWKALGKALPKGTDFSGKILVDGKQVAEIKFPRIALARIVEALNKEQEARAAALVSDPALSGDLTYATLPAGCSIARPSGSGGSGCYLTTAAVDVVGLPDDCWELRQLRAFRDRFAASNGKAATMMSDYYAHAPAIVAGISRRADARRVWLNAYWRGIVPAALAGSMRLDRLARHIYVRWAHKLQALAG